MYKEKRDQIIKYIIKQPKAVLSRYFGILVEDLTKLELHLRNLRYLTLIDYYRAIEKVSY